MRDKYMRSANTWYYISSSYDNQTSSLNVKKLPYSSCASRMLCCRVLGLQNNLSQIYAFLYWECLYEWIRDELAYFVFSASWMSDSTKPIHTFSEHLHVAVTNILRFISYLVISLIYCNIKTLMKPIKNLTVTVYWTRHLFNFIN